MDSERTFIATEPDLDALVWLRSCLAVLATAHPGVRWVGPDHLHLTLKFLGNVPRSRLEEIGTASEESAAAGAPLFLQVGRPGHFGHRKSPRTFWIGFEESEDLERLRRLQAGLESRLGSLGFPAEERPWTPHLTLGRNPRQARTQGWEDLFPPWPGPGTAAMTFRSIRVYSSELTPSGPIHTILREARRGGVVAGKGYAAHG